MNKSILFKSHMCLRFPIRHLCFVAYPRFVFPHFHLGRRVGCLGVLINGSPLAPKLNQAAIIASNRDGESGLPTILNLSGSIA